jgi:TatD DNase family protein
MFPYYNIHTHHPPINQDVTAIVSVDARNSVMPEYAYCSVGIHPCHADMPRLSDLAAIANHPNVVAIGETGLDKLASTPLDQQEKLFITHIELAEKLHKPLIIHCVKAWQELLHIRKQYTSDIPWIIHGFRGNGELARQLLQFGFHLSFGLYFHPDALRSAWDAHRLYAETDDSNISIEEVYHRLTAHLSITCEALSREILENFQVWSNWQ